MRNILAVAVAIALAPAAHATRPSLPKKSSEGPKAAPAADKKCGFCYGNEFKGAPEWDANLSPKRRRILQVAQGYLHTVSDCGGTKGEKLGADVLEKIYKDALQDVYKPIMASHVRKANHSKWNGPWSWCGIWAAAVMREAGFTDVSWTIGKLKGRSPIAGNKGVRPGDIAFWTGGLNHHNIVEKVDGKDVYTLDGNQECSGIMRKKRKLSSLAGYYNIVGD